MSRLPPTREVFRLLFQGFPLAYGTDEGGCRWSEVDDELISRHLSGEEMIGIYPMHYDPHNQHGGVSAFTENVEGVRSYANMDPDLWMCKWGAIDIDEGDDSLVLARNAETMFRALGIHAWIERSRSKGCHVWIFNSEWVRASTMRRAMKVALQLADIEYDAVYPKQDSLNGPPGNYMRLPYGGNRPAERQEILDVDAGMEFGEFLAQASNMKTPTEALTKAASLYVEPLPVVPDLPARRDYSKEPLMTVDGSRLRGLPMEMFNNGPVPYYKGHGAGRGRHGFLNRFARSMFESGYNRTDVLSWTKDLDSRLGQWWDDGPKFMGRVDCDRQIQRLIQDAERRASR